MVLVESTISLYVVYGSAILKKLSNTGRTPVPPAHAASWGSLTPSISGSKIGAKEARCSDGACVKFDISLLSQCFSPSKKLSNTGCNPVPPAHAGACGARWRQRLKIRAYN